MGFFSGLFGSGKDGASKGGGGRISVMRMLEELGTEFEPQRCSTCKSTFVSGSTNVSAYALDLKDWHLDVGGYCAECRAYYCPSHARFVRMPDTLALKDAAAGGVNPMGPWGVGCCKHDRPFVQNAEAVRSGVDSVDIEDVLNMALQMPPGGLKLRKLKAMDEREAARLVKKAPNTKKYLELIRVESAMDFAKVEEERLALVNELAQRLSDADLTDLVEKSQDLKAQKLTMAAYQTYLLKLCHRNKIDMKKYPGLTAYSEYVIGAETLDRNAIWKELEEVTIP